MGTQKHINVVHTEPLRWTPQFHSDLEYLIQVMLFVIMIIDYHVHILLNGISNNMNFTSSYLI